MFYTWLRGFNKGLRLASSAGTLLSLERACDSYPKLEITPYKVLNMDSFIHKCIDSLQKAIINLPELCVALFMMDRCTF